jgi:hypothetical protein
MTANILETIQQRQGKTAPKSLEYRKAFAECVEQYGDWEHYVKVLKGYDRNLASAIERVAASLSEGHLATPDGLDSFIDDMELNTLYWTATDLNHQAGKDGDEAFQMAKAIDDYHFNDSREAEKQTTLAHLGRDALDEPGILCLTMATLDPSTPSGPVSKVPVRTIHTLIAPVSVHPPQLRLESRAFALGSPAFFREANS